MAHRFRGKPKPPPEQPATEEEPALPRFDHPKVICIDVRKEAVEKLRAAGYRVTSGTLGLPYVVKAGDGFVRPHVSSELPGFAEQEIVVVQHFPPPPMSSPTGQPPVNTTEPTVWVSCRQGIVDIRPYVARFHIRDDVARILNYGGVVVCFCSPRVDAGLVWGESQYSGVFVHQELNISTWDMVPEVESFRFKALHGEEIHPRTGTGLFAPLAPHLQTAKYFCTIEAVPDDHWHPLAQNKYGADVAGILVPANRSGLIVLLPQVKDQGAALQVLLDDIMPGFVLTSKLFPESEKFVWRGRPPYELPQVLALRVEIEEVRANAEVLEGELLEQIDTLQAEHGWVLDLLSGTGGEFVDAVETALRELGLPDVQKVDEAQEAREQGRLREDIQVLGGSPLLLVEAKGLTSTPKEEDTLAVTKYLVPRMKEWKRTDVRGLAVINHQRGLPPLERDNESTFQADVLENALHQGFTIITGFDLYRLVINKRGLGWPEDTIAPLFYTDGRVNGIPTHYSLVGTVDHFYDNIGVVAIAVEGIGVAVGDRLGFELPVAFVEQEVTSIHLDDIAVRSASAGQRVGVKTSLTKAQARNGLRVYRLGDQSWFTAFRKDAPVDAGELELSTSYARR